MTSDSEVLEQNPEARSDASFVADYLRTNPDFLESHPDVLDAMRLQHQQQGAVSLIERQIRGLREQSEQQRARLDSLLDVASENDALNRRVHRTILELIGCVHQDLIACIQQRLSSEFGVEMVEVRLFESPESAALPFFDELLSLGEPRCGRLPMEVLVMMFGEESRQVRSAVLLPLIDGEVRGVLAIADRDEHRYHPGMATDYLASLAEVFARLLRVQRQSAVEPG